MNYEVYTYVRLYRANTGSYINYQLPRPMTMDEAMRFADKHMPLWTITGHGLEFVE